MRREGVRREDVRREDVKRDNVSCVARMLRFTNHVSRITFHESRITNHVSNLLEFRFYCAEAGGGAGMQPDKAGNCRGTDDPAGVPNPVGIEIVHDQTGRHGADHGGNSPGKLERGHVAAAHVFRCKEAGQHLSQWHDDHFTKGDDHDGDDEQGVTRHEPVHRESDHVEQGAGRHHQHRRITPDAPGHPELQQHDQQRIQAEQQAIPAVGHTVHVTQVDRQCAVHLLVDNQHQHGSQQEADEQPVAHHDAIPHQGLPKGRRLTGGGRLWFGFGNQAIDDKRRAGARDGIGDEEQHVGLGRQQTADRRPQNPGQVSHDAQDRKTFGALRLWQDVGHHRLVGWPGDAAEQADDYRQDVEGGQIVEQSHDQAAQRTAHQAKGNDRPATYFIGQGAANDAAHQAGDRKEAEQQARFGHAHTEPARDVQRKIGVQNRAPQAIDEHRDHQGAETGGERLIGLFEAADHGDQEYTTGRVEFQGVFLVM